jgi:ABC-type Mn2+/Zn2+ transport system ATPase subunit
MSFQHLDNLTVHSFRGIQNLTISDAKRVNLLVGPNNSGKTSVLEAISVFCRPLDSYAWIELGRNRGTSRRIPWMISSESYLQWLFPAVFSEGMSAAGNIRVSGSGRCFVREVRANYKKIKGYPSEDELKRLRRFGRSPDPVDGSEEYTGFELDIEASFDQGRVVSGQDREPLVSLPFSKSMSYRYWNRLPTAFVRSGDVGLYSYPSLILSAHDHIFEDPYVPRFSRLSRQLKDELVQLLRVFDSDVEGLEVHVEGRGESYLKILHKAVGAAPAMVFGDGMRRALIIATNLITIKGGILLLDEIETAIHAEVLPKVMGWLFKACAEMDVQVFATTHSLEAVDAFIGAATESQDDFVTFNIRNLGKSCERLDYDTLYSMRNDSGFDVR